MKTVLCNVVCACACDYLVATKRKSSSSRGCLFGKRRAARGCAARRRCNARALSHALAPPYAGVVGALVVGRPTAQCDPPAGDARPQVRAARGPVKRGLYSVALLFAAAGHSPGTFVEIGAYDGSDGSQTHLLENCFGWSGVLIEASNRNYDKLTKNERRKPPTQKVYSAVCARGVGTVTVSNGGGTVAGVTSDMAGGFKRQWSKAHNDCGGFECTTKVPCKPLPDVMADAGFPRANFLSLDVEGGEARVMGTVLEVVGNSSENFPFDVVMAEADRHSARKNQWVRDMLKQVGMVQVPFMYSQGSYNDLFVRPHLQPFAKHLNRKPRLRSRTHGALRLASRPSCRSSPSIRCLVTSAGYTTRRSRRASSLPRACSWA